jgi:hypothetical protein
VEIGAIRKTPLGSLKGNLEQVEANLMRLDAGELANHPLVCKLVKNHTSDQGNEK